MTRPVAVVTGSASGIGAASAHGMAARGYDVVINYSRSSELAVAEVERCMALGGRAIAVRADVSEDADCRAMVATTLDEFGRIDVLINSAGTTKLVDHADLNGLASTDFMRIYAVNCLGTFQMVRACEPSLRASPNAAVVNVSAIAALRGTGSSLAYVASKGALNAMSLALARALGPEVRVNVVCPGLVESRWMHDLHGDRYDNFRAAWEAGNPLGTTANADEVAETIVWLATAAPQMTGQIVAVDSGWLLGPRPPGSKLDTLATIDK